MQSLCYTLATLLCGSICFVFRVFNMRHLAGAARHHQIDKSMKCEVSSTTKTSNQLKAIKPQQEVTRTQQQQKNGFTQNWVVGCWWPLAYKLLKAYFFVWNWSLQAPAPLKPPAPGSPEDVWSFTSTFSKCCLSYEVCFRSAVRKHDTHTDKIRQTLQWIWILPVCSSLLFLQSNPRCSQYVSSVAATSRFQNWGHQSNSLRIGMLFFSTRLVSQVDTRHHFHVCWNPGFSSGTSIKRPKEAGCSIEVKNCRWYNLLKQWSLGNFDPISLSTPNYYEPGRRNRHHLKMCNTLTLLGFSGLDNLVEVSLASPPHQKAKGKDAHRESCTWHCLYYVCPFYV